MVEASPRWGLVDDTSLCSFWKSGFWSFSNSLLKHSHFQEDICQCPHLPHQFNICQLWPGISRRTVSSFYHLFSLQETYLSADDLRINLWHMEITDQSFNIVDIKPANMEELTEVKFASLRQTLEGLVLISVALSGYHCLGVPSQGVQSLCLLVQQGNE